MVILAVDPDRADLEQLSQCLRKAYPESRILPFSDPLAAYQYGVNHPAHAIYTVYAMERLDGVDLAKMLRRSHPELEITLISNGDGQIEAMAHIGHQISKPVTVYKILEINGRDIPVQRILEKTAPSRRNRPIRRVF